jgi:hypothetical protein
MLAGFAVGTFALAAVACVPLGLRAAMLLAIADDPSAIAERALDRTFDRTFASREIEAALAAGDSDLAKSFLDLARDRGLGLPAELAARVTAAVEGANSAAGATASFVRGLITGEPDDAMGFAGMAVGDLFVFGDIRDALREGSRYLRGKEADELVLGLSCVGMAITAGTYATLGAGAPVRVGLSAVKAVRKSGRLGADMAGWLGRSARDAVKFDKAGGLVRLARDVGRLEKRAGTKAALDALVLARNPAEVSRLAMLAEKKGSQTRAILKTLGRGAIWISVASFKLALWLTSAVFSLLGCVATLKSAVERATRLYLARKRACRHARYAAMTASGA